MSGVAALARTALASVSLLLFVWLFVYFLLEWLRI
jgi:hypothetical protein